MTEKTAVPEYCGVERKSARINAGFATGWTLTTLPTSGSAALGIGPVAVTLTVAGSIQTDNRPRAHRRSPLKCPIRTERGYLWEDLI